MRGLIWRLIWEHPRARGENENASPKRSRIQGTSPRTRGKHPAEMIPDRPAGNIPAHAGKTMLALTHHQPHWEHPRARGENFRYRIPAPTWGGTSPRTRGKQTLQKIGFMDQGNIPAHAGKTMPRTTSGRITQEHPRARGENTLALPEKNCPQGTSPRTRGKRSEGRMMIDPYRNIPAHAGKTTSLLGVASVVTEHPRARGENLWLFGLVLLLWGTSPRTRGKR